MIYLNTYASVDEAIGTSALTPFVGTVHGDGRVIYADKETYGDKVKLVIDEALSYFKIYTCPYLKFTALEDGSTITLDSYNYTDYEVLPFANTGMTLYYSTDDETYTQWTGQTITLNNGEFIYVYGENSDIDTWIINDTPMIGSSANVHFSMTGKISASGNIQSMISKDMPDTISFEDCYISMFANCTSLVNAPELPATTLASNCYFGMFQGCTSLTTAPELPATALKEGCYASMFEGCTSLVTPPELPATTLATWCYSCLFCDCTSLTTAPELPATALKEGCYASMFEGCTSLVTPPELPATTLATWCYSCLFCDCTSLNYIKAMFTTTPSTTYTNNWVSAVASSGTFVKNSAATWNVTGVNGIPSNWTVEKVSA